jgi:hypothetical protein
MKTKILIITCLFIFSNSSIKAQDTLPPINADSLALVQDSISNIEDLLKIFETMVMNDKIDSVSYSFGVGLRMTRTMPNIDHLMLLKGYFDNQFDTALVSKYFSTQYIRQRNAERRRLRRLRNRANNAAIPPPPAPPSINKDRLDALKAIHATRIEQGERFLKEYAQQKDVKVTESGLYYRQVIGGSGSKPTQNNRVKLYYICKNIDGVEYFNSNGLAEMSLKFTNLPIFKEAVPLIPVGATYEFAVPYQLAYNYSGKDKISPFETLVFTIEVMKIID